MFAIASRRKLPAVLLIDDDLVSREVTATLLTMSGYSVHSADSGEAAVLMLKAGGFLPGVVLMDAQMPGLNGAALIVELRAQSEAPIYAISASELPQDIGAAVDGSCSSRSISKLQRCSRGVSRLPPHRISIPRTRSLVQRFWRSSGSSCRACRTANLLGRG